MKVLAENRRARFDYHLGPTWEAGLALEGWEVKSARAGEVSLAESFIRANAGATELWLQNAYFAPYRQGEVANQNLRRNRKLLLRRAEIQKIVRACAVKGNTCVPLKIYLTPAGLIKIAIAVATGKHAYDKKQALKQRDLARETARTIASR